MYTLDATDSFRVDSTKDTYIYDIIPTANGIVTISSDNSLILLDPLALNTPLNIVKNVNKDVTCATIIEGDNGSSNLIGTAGRDGKLTLTDFRCKKVGEIFSSKCHASDSEASYIAYHEVLLSAAILTPRIRFFYVVRKLLWMCKETSLARSDA